MIKHRKIAGQQEPNLGDLQLVRVAVGHALPSAYDVIGRKADHATSQRRQTLKSFGVQQINRSSKCSDGIPAGGHPDRCVTKPRRLAIDLSEHRCATYAHKAITRP